MRDEIQAAVQHITSLLAHDRTHVGRFAEDLTARLERRCSPCWHIADGERGSARRCLVWHAHGGGEGLDNDLATAARTHTADGTTLEHIFTVPFFTMWIDPGCVAIRLGAGPGSFLNTNVPAPVAIKTIYGSQPASAVPVKAPQLHTRMPSYASSMAGTSISRSTSLSSCSISASEDGESCPSLVTGSSARSSDCSDDEDDEDDCEDSARSEVSLEDMLDNAYFTNFDFVDDDDGLNETLDIIPLAKSGKGHRHGNATITGDDTVCDDEGDETVQPENQAAVKPTITSYDGGNVGVLGGGVRLGGAAKSLPKRKTALPSANPTNVPAIWSEATVSPNANPWSNTCSPLYSMPPLGKAFDGGLAQLPQYVMVDGCPMPAGSAASKRSRTRGRRSRGRGAGRAARRQAAAVLRAQAGQDEDGTTEAFASVEVSGGTGMKGAENLVEGGGALGLTLSPPPTASTGDQPHENDARIMALVRQRANQVAKDIVRRHFEQQARPQLPPLPRTRSANHNDQHQQHRLHHQRSQPQLFNSRYPAAAQGTAAAAAYPPMPLAQPPHTYQAPYHNYQQGPFVSYPNHPVNPSLLLPHAPAMHAVATTAAGYAAGGGRVMY